MRSLLQYFIESIAYDYDLSKIHKPAEGSASEKVYKDFEDIVKKCATEKDKLELKGVIEEVENGDLSYIVVVLYGGLNGSGNFADYEKTIAKIAEETEKKHHCWLVQNINDCPDDVFTLFIGISLE